MNYGTVQKSKMNAMFSCRNFGCMKVAASCFGSQVSCKRKYHSNFTNAVVQYAWHTGNNFVGGVGQNSIWPPIIYLN